MAVLRVCVAVALILLGGGFEARAEDAPAMPPGLYDRPVLVVDPGMHIAEIRRASADRDGRWAVTGSLDKTIRVWSLADGSLARTIRVPAGPVNVGKVYAVAISPDGTLIAAGGWTRATDADRQEQIYLYDRESGVLKQRIEGLPEVVFHLAFSPDGTRLAAVLGDGKGLRVYTSQSGWADAARDETYRDHSLGAAFAPDGALATTSLDGLVRLYTGALRGPIRPARVVWATGGERPFGIGFSPDGTRLVLGYDDTTRVDLLDARTLAPLQRPGLDGTDDGNLGSVAWSRDGATLFAAGGYRIAGGPPVLAWASGGAGAQRILPAGKQTVTSLIPLPDGDLLVAAADPWLARLAPDGTPRWRHPAPAADFTAQFDRLTVSDDGTRIGFGFQVFGASPARFDLAAGALTPGAAIGPGLAAPRQTGLPVERWQGQDHPTLFGKPLPSVPYERSRSLAIHPNGDRFVLGTEWFLHAFDAEGAPLWTRLTPAAAWAVNITGDGRLVVAAYGDGSIRWHRMADGVELLAFMPLANQKDWVAWTPEGFYDATPGAQGVLRWQVNHGWDAPATDVPVADIPGSYRPNVLPLVLQQLETPRALGLALLAEHNEEIRRRTNSHVPPGTRLHLLAVGVGTYQQDDHLHLKFANHDAESLASAIKTTQEPLYTVEARSLLNQDANKKGIMTTLASIGRHMEAGGDNDLAVVFFSGHGAMVGANKLYLLPYDADVREDASLRASAISVDELRDALLELAKHGRVLVLLDACHSGATTISGETLTNNQDALKGALAAANITVLTSSSGSEFAREDEKWGHGAFTRALLDALGDPMADPSHIGLISSNSLAVYMHQHVPDLTDHQQTPGMEVRFESTVFALAH